MHHALRYPIADNATREVNIRHFPRKINSATVGILSHTLNSLHSCLLQEHTKQLTSHVLPERIKFYLIGLLNYSMACNRHKRKIRRQLFDQITIILKRVRLTKLLMHDHSSLPFLSFQDFIQNFWLP